MLMLFLQWMYIFFMMLMCDPYIFSLFWNFVTRCVLFCQSSCLHLMKLSYVICYLISWCGRLLISVCWTKPASLGWRPLDHIGHSLWGIAEVSLQIFCYKFLHPYSKRILSFCHFFLLSLYGFWFSITMAWQIEYGNIFSLFLFNKEFEKKCVLLCRFRWLFFKRIYLAWGFL